ncbi:MAG: hypothetical protein V3W50_07160 [Thermoanaerobaculia bacterium]|jgi:uncharacterized membrane protein
MNKAAKISCYLLAVVLVTMLAATLWQPAMAAEDRAPVGFTDTPVPTDIPPAPPEETPVPTTPPSGPEDTPTPTPPLPPEIPPLGAAPSQGTIFGLVAIVLVGATLLAAGWAILRSQQS